MNLKQIGTVGIWIGRPQMPIRIRHNDANPTGFESMTITLFNQRWVTRPLWKKTLVYTGKIEDFLTFSPHIVSSCIGVLCTISIKNFITFCVHYTLAGNPKLHTSAQSLIQSIVTALQVPKLTTRKVRWYCNESLQWMQTLNNVRLMAPNRHAGSWIRLSIYAKQQLKYLNLIVCNPAVYHGYHPCGNSLYEYMWLASNQWEKMQREELCR